MPCSGHHEMTQLCKTHALEAVFRYSRHRASVATLPLFTCFYRIGRESIHDQNKYKIRRLQSPASGERPKIREMPFELEQLTRGASPFNRRFTGGFRTAVAREGARRRSTRDCHLGRRSLSAVMLSVQMWHMREESSF